MEHKQISNLLLLFVASYLISLAIYELFDFKLSIGIGLEDLSASRGD